jgi:hypothetical protein
MPTEQQFPTSFRFTAQQLADLDELAGLLYEEFEATVSVSRKFALVIAVKRELVRARGEAIREARGLVQ